MKITKTLASILLIQVLLIVVLLGCLVWRDDNRERILTHEEALSVITNKNSTDSTLRRAIVDSSLDRNRLDECFWLDIGKNPAYTPDHRRRCIRQAIMNETWRGVLLSKLRRLEEAGVITSASVSRIQNVQGLMPIVWHPESEALFSLEILKGLGGTYKLEVLFTIQPSVDKFMVESILFGSGDTDVIIKELKTWDGDDSRTLWGEAEIHRVYSPEVSCLTNYISKMIARIDNDCERYRLCSQIAKMSEITPDLPERFELAHLSFRTNIFQFLSSVGDNDERGLFFAKLDVDLEAKRASLAQLQAPPLFDPFETVGEMKPARLNEGADIAPTKACIPDQVSMDREAADKIELLQLQMHYRNLFYDELAKALMGRTK